MKAFVNIALETAKKIYRKAGLERTFYKTKDGTGFYIHPRDKKKAFLQTGKKRVGIFILESNFDPFDLEDALENYLINNDDELAEVYSIWQDNELVEEFMNDIGCRRSKVPSMNCETKYLRYHRSWDWLMPVIKKIFDMNLDKEKGYNNACCMLKMKLLFMNIEVLFPEVIHFIEWYNKMIASYKKQGI